MLKPTSAALKNILLFLLLFSSQIFAQTFTGSTGALQDNATSTFTCNVSGLNPAVIDSTFGIEQICINALHTWVSDLDFILVAPDGTQILLISALGNDGNNFLGTCLNSNATQSIVTQNPPFSGNFKPMTNLSLANNGQIGNGTWTLLANDNYAPDDGTLLSWNITFGNNPAPIALFTSSNLPIIKINTNGQTIQDEPKIPVDMLIIDNGPGNINHVNDPPNHYNGRAGIEIRGSSSQQFPKKSYGLETADANDIEMDTAIMGMPSESDWILNANYTDKTLMRNTLAYHLSRKMGHYAVRFKYCELIINGVYNGVYIFMEKIKRDNDRVDISKLDSTDNTGNAVTGGYIIKVDKTTGSSAGGWVSNFPPVANGNGQEINFLFDYPDADDITPAQANYIEAYVDSFETALFAPYFSDTLIGYRKYIDVPSFIDLFLINELSKNVDGYRISTYLYKKKNTQGGKIFAGPVWDYDIAFRNADYCDGESFTGWAHEFGNVCPGDGMQIPAWWQRFLQDPQYTTQLKCRWTSLRQNLIRNDSIFVFTDSLVNLLASAQARNFETWPILGTYVWPNPTPYDTSHAAEVIRLRNWLSNRIAWLDQNLPGVCLTSMNATAQSTLSIYPNPAQEELSIVKPTSGNFNVQVLDYTGRAMDIRVMNAYDQYKLDVRSLAAGYYRIVLAADGKTYSRSFVKK